MPVDPRIQAALDAPLRQQCGRFAPKRGATKANGYPFAPGSGPADEICKGCANLVRKEFAKTYFKCRLTETGGAATDIRASSPACSAWEKRGA